MNKKIYLAIPYTGMEEQSFEIANKVAAKLMKEGYVVFSPISHTHVISKKHNLPGNWEFWSKQDIPFIEWCDMIYVISIDGDMELIKKSKGCQDEIKIAKKMGKELNYYEYTSDDAVDEAANAQFEFCRDNSYPRFAPASGVCWNCKQNIYTYITVKSASNTHITECPYCNHSYVD